MQNELPHPIWEQLQIGGGPPGAECLTLRAHGALATGKSRLLIDIMDALKKHPRWKNRIFLLDTRGDYADLPGT